MEDRKPMANITPFGLRMQPDLKGRVEEAARANNRSLNAEIVATLEAKYPPPKRTISMIVKDLAAALDPTSTPEEIEQLLARANAELATEYPKAHTTIGIRDRTVHINFDMRDFERDGGIDID